MELTDGDRVRNLLGAYCRLIDAGDFEGVGVLFARATLRSSDGAVVATGAAEAQALYRMTAKLHADGTPSTQHVVVNTTFDEGTDADVVVARSTYLVFQATDSLPLQPILTGAYVDTFAREDGAWHFTDRTFSIGRSGDLSEHLIFDPAILEGN